MSTRASPPLTTVSMTAACSPRHASYPKTRRSTSSAGSVAVAVATRAPYRGVPTRRSRRVRTPAGARPSRAAKLRGQVVPVADGEGRHRAGQADVQPPQARDPVGLAPDDALRVVQHDVVELQPLRERRGHEVQARVELDRAVVVRRLADDREGEARRGE